MRERVLKNGKIVYDITVRADTNTVITRTFDTVDEAIAWEKIAKKDKESIKANKKPGIRFEKFALLVLEKEVRTGKAINTYNAYRTVLTRNILPIIGKKLLKSVVYNDIIKIKERMQKKELSPVTINHTMAILKRIFNQAMKRDLVNKNPLQSFEMLKKPPKQFKYWTKEDIKKFFSLKNDRFQALFFIASQTGMRNSEMLGLKWDAVDFNRKVITVKRTRSKIYNKHKDRYIDEYGGLETTKSNKGRFIPITARALETLLWLFEDQQEHNYVFIDDRLRPISPHRVGTELKRRQKRAGLVNIIKFHDIRHTFASHYMMNGGNVYDLQKLLGHGSVNITEMYAHLSPEHLSETVQFIS